MANTRAESAKPMRAIFVIALLAVTAAAGCLDSKDSDSGAKPILDPTDPANYTVPEVPQVDAVELLADHAAWVRANPNRRANTVDHENSRVALMEQFESYGLEAYRHNFTQGIAQANIVAIKWGVVRDQWVVVGGHYDIVDVPPCPPMVPNCPTQTQGAYDDGSGTMMSVHLGKAFANTTPYYTMAFVAFDGEERGTQGARAFVRDFMVDAFDANGTEKTPYGQIKIVGALNLDMIGLNWPGVMAPINVLTNSEMTYEVANQKRIDMSWPNEQWRRKTGLMLGSSDYARFWEVTEEQGGPIPTMFFIADFEEIGAPNAGGETPPSAYTPFGAYPFWHLEDTVETMTLMAGGQANLVAGFQSAVDVSATVLHALACQPMVTFDAKAM